MAQMTRDLAWAGAMDAGNRTMRQAGRKTWNVADYQQAVQTFYRLWPITMDEQEAISS